MASIGYPARSGTNQNAAADNAAATATHAGAAGEFLEVSHIDASFSAAGVVKLVTLKDNASSPVTYWQGYTDGNGLPVDFTPPIKIADTKSAVAVLAASGTGGVIGTINCVAVRRLV